MYDDDVRGSAAHYLVIAYDLGDIRLLVRLAADAYFLDDSDDEAGKTADDDPQAMNVNNLEIRLAGNQCLSPVIELKTMPLAKNNQAARFREKRQEAWISQTGHFMVAKWRETT